MDASITACVPDPVHKAPRNNCRSSRNRAWLKWKAETPLGIKPYRVDISICFVGWKHGINCPVAWNSLFKKPREMAVRIRSGDQVEQLFLFPEEPVLCVRPCNLTGRSFRSGLFFPEWAEIMQPFPDPVLGMFTDGAGVQQDNIGRKKIGCSTNPSSVKLMQQSHCQKNSSGIHRFQ